MKVLLLAYDFGTSGGVGSFNYELAMELSKLGVEVYVVTRSEALNRVKTVNNVKFHGFLSLKIPPKDVTFHILNAKNISDMVKAGKFDVIHDSSSSISLIPWISRAAPIVSTVHGSPLLGYLRLMYSSMEDKIRHLLFKMVHRLPPRTLGLLTKPYVSRLVFVSKSCFVDALVHATPKRRKELLKRSRVIYSGVSVEKLQSLRSKRVNRARLVYSGRLMEYKGVGRLIKAIPHIAREVPEVEVFVLGSGPRLRRLKNLAIKCGVRSRVRFLGWLERAEALKILASSSILVHPSLYESFGYSIVEAYALSKPVVAHRAPYSIELVENMGAGLVVNSFDEKDLANAIIKVLDDQSLYKRLSDKAFQAARKYFNIRETARKYIRVYEEAVERP